MSLFLERLGILDSARDYGPALAAPTYSALPTTSGGSTAGSVHTATPGTASGNPTPTISGQWQRGGIPIAGETGLTYTTSASDEGLSVTYLETATNSQGMATAESVGITIDVPETPEEGPTPVPDWAGADVDNNNANQTSIVATVPTHDEGDILMFIGQGLFQTLTDGWTEHASFTEVVHYGSSTSTDNQLTVQVRRATASEPATYTFDITPNGNSRLNGVMVAIPGVATDADLNDIFDVIGTPKEFTGLSSHTVDEVTTTGVNRRVISIFCFNGTDGQPVSTSGTGWTEQKEVLGGNTAGNSGYPLLVISDKEQATAGATGDVTHGTAVADRGVSLQLALKPVAGAGSGEVDNFPPLVGTLTPESGSPSIIGYRDNGSDPALGSVASFTPEFAELWVRTTGTAFAVDDVRIGSALPLAKVNSADGLRVGFRNSVSGTALGPITVPWESEFSRYGVNFPGAAAFLEANEGTALDFYYEELAPAGGGGGGSTVRFDGYAADTTVGGQGGEVIFVTSSANSGAGTLRDALLRSNPRIILPLVRSVTLTSQIQVGASQGNFSLYGEYCGGLQIRGASGFSSGTALLKLRCSNYIIRGIRARCGDAVGADVDTLSIGSGTATPGVSNIILKNNTIVWGVDENMEIAGGIENFTLTDNIIAQGLQNSIHSKGEHSMGLFLTRNSTLWARRGTIARNLLAYNRDRNPWMKHGQEIEFVNNYIFGPGCDNSRYGQFASNVSDQTRVNCSAVIRRNFYEKSAQSGSTTNGITLNNGGVSCDWYIEGNIFRLSNGSNFTPQLLEDSGSNVSTTTAPFTTSGITIMDPEDVPAYVLANAGAFPADHDATDAALLALVAAKSNGIINAQASYPTYAAFTPRTGYSPTGIPTAFAGTYDTIEEYCDALLAGDVTPEA